MKFTGAGAVKAPGAVMARLPSLRCKLRGGPIRARCLAAAPISFLWIPGRAVRARGSTSPRPACSGAVTMTGWRARGWAETEDLMSKSTNK